MSEPLYLPKFCIVPLAARLDKTLSDSAKIYLGELNALTNKFGYCWASDERLAEMKEVSVRTIKNWHKDLEDRGFIKRDTWTEHVKDPEKGILVRKKRKIYIFDGGSNNVSEVQNSAPRSEGQNSAPRSEGQNSALIKQEPLNQEHKNNNTPQPQVEKVCESQAPAPDRRVVVFSCLQSLEGIPEPLKKKLCEKWSEQQIQKACEVVKGSKNVENPSGLLVEALKNGYEPRSSKEDILEKNRKWKDSKIKPIDGKKVGPYQVNVCQEYVEFSAAGNAQPKIFQICDTLFPELVCDFINAIKNKQVVHCTT